MKIGQGMKEGMWAFFQIQEIWSIIVISAHAEYSVMLTKMPNPGCFKVLIQFMDVGNFILAGDSIEIKESSLLMQFLAAGDVLFGFGPLNIT